jgi:hypothetical protein
MRWAALKLLGKSTMDDTPIDYLKIRNNIKLWLWRIETDYWIDFELDSVTKETTIYTTWVKVCNLVHISIWDFANTYDYTPEQWVLYEKYREKYSKLQERAQELTQEFSKFVNSYLIDLQSRRNTFTDIPQVIDRDDAIEAFHAWIDYFWKYAQSLLNAYSQLLDEYEQISEWSKK